MGLPTGEFQLFVHSTTYVVGLDSSTSWEWGGAVNWWVLAHCLCTLCGRSWILVHYGAANWCVLIPLYSSIRGPSKGFFTA